ncbi:L-serine ammonia-lyase, iron-sulfur-dependent, subunit alpha [Irregularibacter muris]|uniref:L-serine dehydratase n=1 Tax=Irregularibacter muris TaxID=1796619 RepID=A0AAE3HHE4_9FIRM|nr:L-serine ammonia-lyase, iron-sulfur-dependent, subunit alpha [Irregularibacter muris]MCR1900236.1 L-serine ammonia-lyase, iron-sulfur-dependent, subunit alpha [Irregularibacter muris]
MAEFHSGEQLLQLCNEKNLSISQIIIENEMELTGLDREQVVSKMKDNVLVMRQSIKKGLEENIKSVSGMIGGEAKKMRGYFKEHQPVSGNVMADAVSAALAVTEVNAAMGQIVAAPTAGSCGIIPGALLTAAENMKATEEEIINALFVAAGIGNIIAQNATVAGAEGGCQAETGSASAMAAAGIVEMAGGSPEQAIHAAAMTLKNILGLVCDPIAGLVEAPCSKRNALGTANALVSADMALAGIQSIIPFDEVVTTMYKIGRSLPCELRETALGGLAATPTGQRLQKEIFGK